MIHITAQMRVLVAIEPVDGRKGIDSLVRVCQDQEKTLFPVVFLCSGAGEARRFDCSAMTARDIGLRRSIFPKGDSGGGRKRPHRQGAGGIRSPVADGGP